MQRESLHALPCHLQHSSGQRALAMSREQDNDELQLQWLSKVEE